MYHKLLLFLATIALLWGENVSQKVNQVQKQVLTLFNDVFYYDGNSTAIYTTSHFEPDISVESFTNLQGASSFFLNGTWILYGDKNYQNFLVYATGSMRFSFHSTQYDTFKSGRFAGKSENSWSNTFTCYEKMYYEGEIQSFDGDFGSRIAPCSSLVLTGTSQVSYTFDIDHDHTDLIIDLLNKNITTQYTITIYSEENYSGSSQCILAPLFAPANGIKDSSILGISGNKGIGSIKFGCFSRNIYQNDPILIENELNPAKSSFNFV